MKIITIVFFLYFILLFPDSSFCQKFLNNTFLTGGFSFSNQDRRLFNFPGAAGVIEREDSKFDYEYNVFLQKRVLQFNNFQTSAGIGYSEFNSTFSRPFAHAALNGVFTKELRKIKKYTINKFILPVSSSFFLNEKQSIYLNFNILPAIAFKKSAKDLSFEKTETKWEWKFNAFELYPGIGVKVISRIWLTANYRLFYIYKIDEVIFNDLLFNEKDPEFLQKDYDTYNPFKLWFTVSYALGE